MLGRSCISAPLSLFYLFGLSLFLQDGYTALIYAALEGHPKVVEALLAAGADKEAKDMVST